MPPEDNRAKYSNLKAYMFYALKTGKFARGNEIYIKLEISNFEN